MEQGARLGRDIVRKYNCYFSCSSALPPLPSAIVTSINSDAEGVQCFVRDLTLTVGTTEIKKLGTLLLSLSVTLRQILYGIPVFVWMAQFEPLYPDVSGHGSLITIHRTRAG